MAHPEVVSTRRFRTAFMQCIGRHPSSLKVVSPFIGNIPGFGSVVDFARILLRNSEVAFQLVTRPPFDANNSWAAADGCITSAYAEALVRLGVELLIRTSPLLHSKVYQFAFREGDHASFVGSANFSRGGFELNDETVAVFRDIDDNRRVSAELDRLCGRGSSPYHLWKIQPARR
jgi:phosphatidylserine/phosphatidylglycerophosphate/cardiolipin synthase-like enzyme